MPFSYATTIVLGRTARIKRSKSSPFTGPAAGLKLFPHPGPPKYRLPARLPKNKKALERLIDRSEEYATRLMAHTAVNINDPPRRRQLLRTIMERIESKRALLPAMLGYTHWLFGVMLERNEIPHLARGNAKKYFELEDQACRLCLVLHSLQDLETLEAKLRSAADKLNISYSKARSLYYSDDGIRFSEMPPEDLENRLSN